MPFAQIKTFIAHLPVPFRLLTNLISIFPARVIATVLMILGTNLIVPVSKRTIFSKPLSRQPLLITLVTAVYVISKFPSVIAAYFLKNIGTMLYKHFNAPI